MSNSANSSMFDDRISVRSANIDLGVDLPTQARKELARTVTKYFDGLEAAAVFITRERRVFRATIQVAATGAGEGAVVGEGSGFSPHEAFDTAHKKVAKQLRRRKRAVDDQKTSVPDGKRAVPQGASLPN